jgi:DNA-binding transcriptional LysR family regulator
MASESQLRHIVTLTDLASYRQAAELLGVTHSALSQTVSRLEARYGVKLFERVGRRTVPTAYGEVLVAAARRSLDAMRAANHEIELMQSVETGKLVIGADPSIAQAVLSPALAMVAKAHPGFRFTVRNVSWRERDEALRSHRVDLWLGPDEQRDHEDLAFERYPFPYPIAVCRADHPAVEAKPQSLLDLTPYRVVGGDLPDSYHAPFAALEAALGLTPSEARESYVTSENMYLIVGLIFTAEVIAIVPAMLVNYFLRDGEMVALPIKELQSTQRLPACVAWRADRSASPAAEVLRGALRECFKKVHEAKAPWRDIHDRPSLRAAAKKAQPST